MIATQKLQGFFDNWFKCLRRERALQDKPKIKTYSWLKSYIDMRLYRDLLFKEEVLEEKSIVVQEKIMVREKKPILIQEANEPMLGFNETRDEEKLVRDGSTYKASNPGSTPLDPHIKETMEVQAQAQVDDFMEVQVHVPKIEAMKVPPMEIISSFSSYICLLKVNGNNPNLRMKIYPLWVGY